MVVSSRDLFPMAPVSCPHRAQAFHQYIEPSMQWADIVVPQGAENKVAMDLIVHHVKDKLRKVCHAPTPCHAVCAGAWLAAVLECCVVVALTRKLVFSFCRSCKGCGLDFPRP